MTRIYYTAVENGDGSLGVEFFRITRMYKSSLEDNYPEYYRVKVVVTLDVEGSFDKHILSIRK